MKIDDSKLDMDVSSLSKPVSIQFAKLWLNLYTLKHSDKNDSFVKAGKKDISQTGNLKIHSLSYLVWHKCHTKRLL